jgi:hypothetical protein
MNIAPGQSLYVVEGLVQVVVNRDLQLKKNDDLPSRNIIEESRVELTQPLEADAAGAKLDKIQKKLRAVIPAVH